MKKEIKELVEYALNSKSNKKKELVIGKVNKQQASQIEHYTGINMFGCERVIDNYMIRHTIGKHGSAIKEAKQGQIAINTDDFLLLPDVFSNPDSIVYVGKNSLKQDCFKYSKMFQNTVVIIEAVRLSSRGNKMVFTTMYKKK